MARAGRTKTAQKTKSAAKKGAATKPKSAAKKPVVKKPAVKKKAAAKKKPAGARSRALQSLTPLTGGCMCGEVRYRLTPLAAEVDYCHCDMCRKWSGAPVSAWAQVPASQFRLTKGTATPYVSSKIGIRYFCPTCGTSIFMTDEAGSGVGVMLGTLDDQEALQPVAHGFWPARLAWFKLTDDLARWPQDPPPSDDPAF